MTNRELAKLLGISPATFSMIINNKPGISSGTRERVLQRLAEMGYSHLIKTIPADPQPSLQKRLCFVVYIRHGKVLNQHPFFLLLMESIEAQARKFGYYIMMMTIDSHSPVQPQIESLNQMNASGAIVFATEMLEKDIVYFSDLTIPYVAIDNDFSHLNVNTVSINNWLGTQQAIEYLVRQGHRKIGYLQSEDYISSFGEREKGYREALSRFNLTLEPQYIYRVRYSEEGRYLDTTALLKQNRPLPTAFVCDDDTIATGALRAFQNAGLRVPEDISLIGFNDRPNTGMTQPPLTSVNVPRYSFGTAAVDAIVSLIDKIQNDPSAIVRTTKTRIGTQLTVRNSVQPASTQSESPLPQGCSE